MVVALSSSPCGWLEPIDLNNSAAESDVAWSSVIGPKMLGCGTWLFGNMWT